MEDELKYCGVGITKDISQSGLVVASISPDSDLSQSHPFLQSNLFTLQVGDRITHMREEFGEWEPIEEGDSLRGPAGSRVSIRFERPSDGAFSMPREINNIERKHFTGDALNLENPDFDSCPAAAFVEVDPAALGVLDKPTQFGALETVLSYRG